MLFRSRILHKKLNYELAIYTMDVKNKFVVPSYYVPGSTTTTYTKTMNAGKGRHQGVELSLNYNYDLPAGASSVEPNVCGRARGLPSAPHQRWVSAPGAARRGRGGSSVAGTLLAESTAFPDGPDSPRAARRAGSWG